ncbi:MAG: hypothetical protein L0219_07035 [Phycisphaerales bacterium]|nr:hypothetical protein [Phycisphaerales bacterium]
MSQGLHRQRAPVHLSQSAITFRTYRNRKQHLWLEVICVSLVVCLSLLAWVFVKYATTGTQQQWGRCAATVAAFPAMFAVLGFMIPQTALRITDSTVTFARTRCPRSRVRLRWDEIDRLRCGNRFIVLEGQAGQIWINSTLCTPTSWQQVREQLTNKLQDRFDLGKPSLREMRSAIDSTATSRAFTKLVIVLHTVGLPGGAARFILSTLHHPVNSDNTLCDRDDLGHDERAARQLALSARAWVYPGQGRG